ncbi:AraC family transcriptional regulator [Streptomyces sp. S.PB5]|uniref:AraC family transcriptional regulator n=1 Tax=Streptomyces sp. S.PB5 TaxID=3020844 RepID=UPI0025B1DFEC|nr:AraC family transcriptional regulator [Streptomyces sp. S.PB5]MDN3029081.1 AraC family transcriptional regulator [Streptomyces sp. S.PB5]
MVDFDSLPIPVVPYAPVCRPGSGITVTSFQELLSSVPREFLASPHRLEFHQLLLVTQGTGTFSLDSTRFECRPGSLLWIRPNQVVQAAPQHDLAGELIMFTEAFPPRMSARFGMLDDVLRPSHWRLGESELADLGRILSLLREEFRRPERGWGEDVLKHLLAVLLLSIDQICRSNREHGTPLVPVGDNVWGELFVRFRKELERSYRVSRQVEDYAAALNCTTRALSRACRAVAGTTAKNIIDARVALEARRLLMHTRLPIGAVARQLGFTEVTNFTKFFIRRVNMTPGAFRRSSGTLIGPPANVTDGPEVVLPPSSKPGGNQFEESCTESQLRSAFHSPEG